MSKKVVILQQLLPHYRVPFFEGLRTRLAADGVELVLVHGAAAGARAARRDEASLPWATTIKNRSFTIGGRELLVWQPALKHTRDADLVVVEQANRLLLNYLLLLRRPRRLAFWGHGANLQSRHPNGPSERFKRSIARQPDWWFAYTKGSADRITSLGFPRDRITTVNNAIDTSALQRVEEERIPLATAYVGALDPTKRIDFLIEAAGLLAAQLPGFHLTVAGDGPLRHVVQDVADRKEWLDFLGPLFGDDQARLLKRSQIVLMPGMVGLVSIDSFAAEAPVVTIAASRHSPEFEYLQHKVNALVLDVTSVQAYAAEVAKLLKDERQLSTLRAGCASSSTRYTVENMIESFALGLLEASSR